MNPWSPLLDAAQRHHLDVAALHRAPGLSTLLIGNSGPAFTEQALARNPGPDPVDHATREIAAALVEQMPHGVRHSLLFPFSPGAPHLAPLVIESGLGKTGRLGLLMHSKRGPWWALRIILRLHDAKPGALEALAERLAPDSSDHPCLGCDAPCISACPARALPEGLAMWQQDTFSPGFDIGRCVSHLQGGGCRTHCAARDACPAGLPWRYTLRVHHHHHNALIKTLQRAQDVP